MVREKTSQVVQYLRGEGLLEYKGLGGSIGITHLGVVEVEQSLADPLQGTEHFPAAINIVNIGEMYGSQIQQGTVHSQQHGQFVTAADREPLQELVNALREVLPEAGLAEEDRRQAEAELATVEAQLSSPKPKRSFIRTSLETVRDLLSRSPAWRLVPLNWFKPWNSFISNFRAYSSKPAFFLPDLP